MKRDRQVAVGKSRSPGVPEELGKSSGSRGGQKKKVSASTGAPSLGVPVKRNAVPLTWLPKSVGHGPWHSSHPPRTSSLSEGL